MAGGDEIGFSLDTWTALLAGSSPWATDEVGYDAWHRLLGFFQVFALSVTLGTLWWSQHSEAPDRRATLFIGTAALSLLMVQPLMRVVRRPQWPRGLPANLAIRVTLLAAACVSIYGLLPGWHTMWSMPFAIAMGIDASLTCSELGWQAQPALRYRRLLTSWFHFGIIGALAASLMAGGRSQLGLTLPIYICAHVWAAAGSATLWVLSVLETGETDERAQALAEVVERERRQSAHWLHDDVCAQLRLVSLKLQTNTSTKDEIIDLLNDFDHQLRLRQLDELFGAGSIRVAEVLQPYIRHVQNQGVRIEGVPGFEQAAITLDEQSARLAARAANVLTSNALNAGVSSLSYDIRAADGMLHLVVSDNGPGFDLSDVPHGRGLWTLINDLRPGGVDISRNDHGGSTVRASIPYSERTHRGRDTSRR